MKLKGITSAILSCGIIASMAGVVSGTLAWYQYSTRVNASYTGVAVNSISNLQIGLRTSLDLSDIPGLKPTTMGGTYYWFAGDGQNLTPSQISAFLEKTIYANNALYPVTTSSYQRDSNDSIKLYETLYSGTNKNAKIANHHCYVELPLAFRISLYDNEVFTGDYNPWKNIWITSASTALCENQEESDIQNGLRVFVDGTLYSQDEDNPDGIQSETKYIFNPSVDSSSDPGETVVGGLLDLDKDGFYDFNGLADSTNAKEIIYGDYTGSKETKKNIHDIPYAEPDPDIEGDIGKNYQNPDIPDAFEDWNKTGSTTRSTFTAAHRHHVAYYDNQDGLTFGVAQYDTIKSISGTIAGSGVRTGGKPVCTTNRYGVGNVDLTVYLEGWDHSVIDSGVDKLFSMELNFEISTK